MRRAVRTSQRNIPTCPSCEFVSFTQPIRSFVLLTTLCLAGTMSAFAQETPQATAPESPVNAQEPALAEKIRDISPDKKFALRIWYDPITNQELIKPAAEEIFSRAIKAVELVRLPSKEIVMKLPQNYDGGFERLIWSQDSSWFAFPYGEGAKVTYTHVFHRLRDDFTIVVEPDELAVDVKGEFRDEYVRPIRWLKPGRLLLRQQDYGKKSEAAYQFTAAFDEKTGKFRVVSKKRVPSNE
jgi:hypothetical protein